MNFKQLQLVETFGRREILRDFHNFSCQVQMFSTKKSTLKMYITLHNYSKILEVSITHFTEAKLWSYRSRGSWKVTLFCLEWQNHKLYLYLEFSSLLSDQYFLNQILYEVGKPDMNPTGSEKEGVSQWLQKVSDKMIFYIMVEDIKTCRHK